jgi:predicted lysophospholipase L1 biosynthesis ABC-type transport system permease subunit
MRWADQSARQWLDIERELGEDEDLRRGFIRLQRVIAIRRFADRRRCFASSVAGAVGAVVVLIGVAVGWTGPTVLAAVLAGAAIAAGITFALVWAVLDRPISPVRQDSVDWIQ